MQAGTSAAASIVSEDDVRPDAHADPFVCGFPLKRESGPKAKIGIRS
jgi:hypothetical protein